MADTLSELLDELADASYGSPVTAEYEGVTYRAKIEPDEDSSIFDDGDWYGSLTWVTHNTWTGQADPRPSDYDGAARKLQTRGGDPIWWQPPADLDAENIEAMRTTILDIMEDGYSGLILERCEGTDHYGAPIVRDSVSLWGMAGYDREGLAFVIADLFGEVYPLGSEMYEGMRAYREPDAMRIAPYSAPSSPPGSSESNAWADRMRAWYAGWDHAAHVAATTALASA